MHLILRALFLQPSRGRMMIVGKYGDAPFVRNTSEGTDVLLQRHTDVRQMSRLVLQRSTVEESTNA